MIEESLHVSEETTKRPAEEGLQGAEFRPTSRAELMNVVNLAFNYRGDVTLELKSQETVTGYIFNRVPDVPHPYLELFPLNHPDPRTIAYDDVQVIRFTGDDTASGKSWETWMQKKQEEKNTLPPKSP